MGTFGMWRAGPQRNDAVRIITGVRSLLRPPVRISAAWRSSSALAVIEPEVAEFQRIDEHIDRANRIALVDPIIKAFRQQRRLLAIRPLNETLHHSPAIQQGNHSIDGVFTQSGSKPVML